jgi:hypothetical protein
LSWRFNRGGGCRLEPCCSTFSEGRGAQLHKLCTVDNRHIVVDRSVETLLPVNARVSVMPRNVAVGTTATPSLADDPLVKFDGSSGPQEDIRISDVGARELSSKVLCHARSLGFLAPADLRLLEGCLADVGWTRGDIRPVGRRVIQTAATSGGSASGFQLGPQCGRTSAKRKKIRPRWRCLFLRGRSIAWLLIRIQ